MNLFLDPVFWVEWIMQSALLAVGLYVSYTDIRRRWVPNRFTFTLLVLGLAGQGAMIYLGVTTWSRVVAIFLSGLGVALLLILLGFWAAGDAKLFWAATVALPPSLCPSWEPFFLQAAPAALLLNALLGYLVVLLLAPLWRQEWRRDEEKNRPGGRQWLQSALGQAGLLGLILGFGVLVLEGPVTYLEALAALVIGYRLLERGVPVKYWPVVVIPGMVALAYLGLVSGGWRIYVLFWGMAWLVELIYLQVRFWYGRAFVQILPIPLLQAGAVLRRVIHLRLTEGESFHGQAGIPLSESQVHRLRDLEHRGVLPEGEHVEVEQDLPFVPFIVGAAVLTAFFAGNLLPPLIWVLEWLAV